MEDTKLRRTVTWLCRKKINRKTFRGERWIGRNEPCYCGSKKKFKNCCWAKHGVLRAGSMTPAMADFVKRQNTYFKKTQEIKNEQHTNI